MIELETEHLILRQWQEEDLMVYAKLTASKEVMKYFPKTLRTEESNTAARKFMNLLEKRSWGFWAIEEKLSGKFIGYAGLHAPKTKFPFSPCVEIAWRVADKYWENGYVLELGKEILDCAFEVIGLDEIVYFSSIHNIKAENIMQQLDMIKAEELFLHPFVDKRHRLSKHYLYRIKKI